MEMHQLGESVINNKVFNWVAIQLKNQGEIYSFPKHNDTSPYRYFIKE